MSVALSERFQGVTPDFAISTPDETNVVDFYNGVQGVDSRTVLAYHRRPLGDERIYDVDYELIKIENDGGFSRNSESFVRNVGHAGSIAYFTDHDPTPLVQALGYGWRIEDGEDGDTHHKWIEFSYPNPGKMNEVLNKISPGEGVRFVPYEGGQFTAVEFAEALLDNTIPIAQEQPYQMHDHAAFHVLGYVGLHGELLEDLKQFTDQYLDRYRAEISLPSVPAIEDPRIAEFLHPSHTVLKGILFSADGLSTSVGTKIFGKDEGSRAMWSQALLGSEIDNIYNLRSTNDSYAIPYSLLERPEYEVIQDYARQMEERFKQLEISATKLAS